MRVGLAGCGAWGRLILRDLQALGAQVAVSSRSEATRAKALELGAVSVHPHAEDLPDCDGYVIALLTSLHGEAIETLLPRGRPIYTEKPMTADPAQADRLAAAAPDLLFVMDKWRYHPAIAKMAGMARSGELGEIRALRSWRMVWGNPHPDTDVIWSLATHDISIAHEILGHVPAARWAHAITAGPWERAVIGGLQDDEDGPQAVFEISSLSPVKRGAVTLIGTEGSVHLEGAYAEALKLRRGGEAQDVPLSREMPLEMELKAFLDHLGGGPAPKSSAAEGALTVRRVAELRALAGLRDEAW